MGGDEPGWQAFVAAVNRFAAGVSDPRVAAVAERMAAPLRVAVAGRRGAGRRTVTRALECAGMAVSHDRAADLVVYVVVEVAKPEDVAAVAACEQPVLVVLNKSDLTGAAPAADVAQRLRVPVEPMAALLAVAALDGLSATLWAALQTLAGQPADLGSAERFVTGPHPLAPAIRRQLCDTLDLLGIAQAVAAVRQGRSEAQLRVLLRRLSGVDAVARRLGTVGAAVRYQRLLDAVARLEALGVGDGRIGEFLSGDAFVLARMAAAMEVADAAGLAPGGADAPAGDPVAQLRGAARWQRYSRGPAGALQQACGTDIARGLLRLWSMTGEPVPGSL